MKIFITGGSGLLALNWATAKRKEDTVTLGLHKRNVSLAGVNTYHCSLDSIDSCKEIIEEVNPELVIHTAGLTSVEECEANPKLAYYANVELAKNIANVCSTHKIPLVHISTDHLFAGVTPMADEFHPIAPVNMYGRTKAEAEEHVLDICPEALVVRTNFYGWGPSFRRSFSDVIIDSLRSEKSLYLFQDVFYTPILIDTLVNTVHELLKQKVSGVFNIVGDERISKYEFGIYIAELFNYDKSLIKEGKLNEQTHLIRRPKDMSLSNQKVTRVLGRRLGGVKEQLLRLQQQEMLGVVEDIKSL
jgi:dTDP-4-dehydrorhamnose reductase